EYQQVDELLKNEHSQDILSSKIDEYLNTIDFVEKYSNKVADLFKINQIPSLQSLFLTDADQEKKQSIFIPAFHLLIQESLKNNKPWAYLFEAKEYTLFYGNPYAIQNTENSVFYSPLDKSVISSEVFDLSFFNQDQPENYTPFFKFKKISFAEGDVRIAGILTTPSFFNRFVTTGVNKNRKRAAALFKTLLCKNMVASIPVGQNGFDPNKQLALIGFEKATEEDIFNHTKMTQIHGQQNDCMKCHKQLDPTGALFNLTPQSLSIRPSPGMLSYVNEEGLWIQKKLSGIGMLAKALSTERDYLACQSKHFWTWLKGESSLLTPSKENELVDTFLSVNQRPKDFIKAIILKKDFFEEELISSSQWSAINALKVLKKCQSCHNQDSSNVDLSDISEIRWYNLIYDLDFPNRKKWTLKIKNQIQKGKMPPVEAQKDFTSQELKYLLDWINQGSPNFKGEKRL
ncbi:MAG: DUF1588 domain-containing protein, partial [Bdellovibrionaceae bacterium]|nr:DUF1588 domain-containing protein [Pseudobdellovibrionaceae bacterium]